MPRTKDVQENKAVIREALVKWFASSVQYCDGQIYVVTDTEKRIVKRLSVEDCMHDIRAKSREICAAPGYGAMCQLWAADIKQILEHASTVLRSRGDDRIVAVGDTPLNGDYSERPYAINRLPVDFGLPKTIAEEDWPRALDALMEKLPEFYHDLRSRMVSPEMWDILTAFIGRVISEDTPSEQFLYWWGEGGDGKGSLTDLIFRFMPETSVPIAHDNFESRFGSGIYGEKRFVRIDEAPPGNFFTERVKEVTGGSKYISIEKKGKDAVTVMSRLAILFTSNFSPAFDGSMAQARRLRVVECAPRTSPARDVENEMLASIEAFLAYCLINYAKCGKKIPSNAEDYMNDLRSAANIRIDSWILANIEYDPGGWIPSTDISQRLSQTGNDKIKIERVVKRLKDIGPVMSTDGGIVKGIKKSGVRGWQNIRIKELGGIKITGTKSYWN